MQWAVMYEKCTPWSIFSCLLTFPGMTKEQLFTSITIAQHLSKVRLIDRNTKISVVEELLRFRSFRIRPIIKLSKNKKKKQTENPTWQLWCLNESSRTGVLKNFPCFICLPFVGRSGKVTGSSSESMRGKKVQAYFVSISW